MAFKTFAPGVLTSSDVNTFLMRQAVITCTSSTRPASPSEGMTIYETDTDRYKTYSGSAWEDFANIGAWTSYTPTVNSGGAGTDWALGNGTIQGFYQRFGRTVHVKIYVVWGSTSTFGTKFLYFGLPFTPKSSASFIVNAAHGTCRFTDTSTGNPVSGIAMEFAGSGVLPGAIEAAAAWGFIQPIVSIYPFTWANTDELSIGYTYEAAS